MTLLDSFLIGLGVKPELGGLDTFKSAVLNTVKTVGGIALAFKAAQAAVSGVVLGIASDLDSLSDAAGRVGASVSELDKLEFIATQTDSSAEATRSALLGISSAAGQAALGAKESKEAFEKLGIKIKDSNGKIKSSTALFYEVGDALKKMDKAQQLAYARKFSLDPTIVTTMTSDIAALRDQYDAFAEAAGIDMETAAQASSDLMDEVGKFGKLSQMIMRSVMTGFIIKMKEGFIALRKWLIEHADTVKKVIQTVLSFIERMSNFISSTFSRFGMIFSRLVDWWNTLDDSTQKLILSVIGLAAAFKLLNLGWLLSPIGAVVAAVAGLFLIWDDLMTYLEGGESLIDWGPWVDDIMVAAAVVQELWDKLKEFAAWVWERLDFTEIWEGIKTQLAGVREAFLGAFGILKGLFSGDMSEVEAGLEKFWNGIITFFEGQAQALLGVIKNVLGLIGEAFGIDLSGLIGVVENIFGTLVETARTAIEPITDVIGGIVNTIVALLNGDFSGAFEAAGNVVRSAFSAIEAVVLGTLDVIKELVNWILSGLGIDATAAFETLKNVVGVVFDAIDKAIEIVIGTVKTLVDWAVKAVDKIKEFFGFKSQADEDVGAYKEEEAGRSAERNLSDEDVERFSNAMDNRDDDHNKRGMEDLKKTSPGDYAAVVEYRKKQGKPVPQEDPQTEATSPATGVPKTQTGGQPKRQTPQAAPTQSPDSSNVDVEKPLLNAKNVDVESPPLISEATKAGKVETKTTNIQQNNNVNNDVKITVEGSGDPEEVADRVGARQDDATRYTPPVVSSITGTR